MSRSAKTPLWARLAVTLGCLLLLLPALVARAGHAGSRAEIDGPLNMLLVGIDPRGSHTIPLADTIVVAHVPADRSRVYLFSLPRDLVVQIPAFAASGSPAQRAKINAAMALGSRTGPASFSPAQGFQLLSQTVREVTGIPKFDAGAIINFGGFTKLVAAMGGVKMVIDQDVASEHRKPDGSPRDRLPECQGHHRCLRPYTGEQKIYHRSDKPVRLSAWEALDYVRQRYGLPRSDYDRQRHQRQFLTAVAKRVSRDPAELPRLVAAVGDSLTLVDGGHSLTAWAGELQGLRARHVTAIDLPGSALFENGRYLGEQYPDGVRQFFAAVVEDRVARFLLDHPGHVNIDE
ncbi:LCP family protein [Actinoplanes sp. NPDC024001]|uniref:LCP family protein n=1 Tax=Actinoplanes sp. NPDC024001 TaxID=3154598 RepID=UPI0033E09390